MEAKGAVSLWPKRGGAGNRGMIMPDGCLHDARQTAATVLLILGVPGGR